MKENHGFRITPMGTHRKTESIVGGDLMGEFDVHPDSLRLLEPQVADGAQHPMGWNCYVLSGAPYFEWLKNVGMRVIQRNGIAFMWPESEPT
jgi:hypothetical protein